MLDLVVTMESEDILEGELRVYTWELDGYEKVTNKG